VVPNWLGEHGDPGSVVRASGPVKVSGPGSVATASGPGLEFGGRL
jgi:hypothetical protein